MPSKKKKKAASSSNPARGFATTSIASKVKAEPADSAAAATTAEHSEHHDQIDDEQQQQQQRNSDTGVKLPLQDSTTAAAVSYAQRNNSLYASSSSGAKGIATPTDAHGNASTGTATTTTTGGETALKDLTPDELEARLYTAELQALVDKHSSKSARDAARIAARWSTDVRVLRSNAATQSLSLASLHLNKSDDLLRGLVQTAREDVARGLFWYSSSSSPPSSSSVSSNLALSGAAAAAAAAEEDAVAKIWTVQRTLAAIGFESVPSEEAGGGGDEKVHGELLRFLQRNAAPIDANARAKALTDASAVWGLEEALDWLVLNYPKDALPIYDSLTGKVRSIKRKAGDGDITQSASEGTASEVTLRKEKAQQNQSGGASEDDEDEEEDDVCDLESDPEPDTLLSAYIEAKSRLYRISPDQAAPKRNFPGKSASRRLIAAAAPAKHKPKTVAKLQQKLKQIESDALFDRADADRHWNNERIILARELAEEARRARATKNDNVSSNSIETSPTSLSDAESAEDQASDSGDDDDAIGALFSSVPGNGTLELTGNSTTATVTIRDFGPSKGISPRRVLEETCRARDPGVRFVYRLVSRTAFSNRHSITINWSKPQGIANLLHQTPSMSSLAPNDRTNQFTMDTVATPDAQQSEAFVSTFALFQLFSESPREEKSYLRLPPTWRTLWFEFMEQKKDSTEKEDRQTVETIRKIYRSCIRSRHDQNGDDDGDANGDGDDVVLTHNFRNRAQKPTGKPQESLSKPKDFEQSNGATENASREDNEKSLKDIWTAKSSSPPYQKMLKGREQLPMYRFKNEALAAIESNQVTIICGETGCGKSTQMPSFILESELSKGRACRVYCTEPRRISAITLAQRVSEELGENSKRDLGSTRSLVGYAIRLESKVASTTRLVYATTGIVLRMLESSAGFDDVSHIVIDEVHERSIETDFLLIILRSLMTKRPYLKIILMSATVDATKFVKYFGGAPVLTVPGRTFPVETKFLEDAIELTKHIVEDDNNGKGIEDDDELAEVDLGSSSNAKGSSSKISDLQQYSAKTRSTLSKMNEYRIDYELIVKLIEQVATDQQYSKFSKAILVFLPGIAEIRRLHDMISSAGFAKHFIVHSLHSSIASEDQQNAFSIPPAGMSKIVISTNIAETGVTIPDVTCVIDAGKHKEMRFDERRQISKLTESFISRANAKQRRGRAGRVQEGLCFHLFTKSRHDETMAEQQTPEMLRLSLQDLVMRVKICKLGDIHNVLAQALDPPLAKNIQRAIDALIEVGALTPGQELTSLGKQLSKLPLDPYLGKLVLFGAVFGCLDISLTLAAILTSKSPFVASVGGPKAAADAARASFQRGQSDLLTEFNAYASWRRVCTTASTSEYQFCKKSSLSVTTLCSIEDLKAQLLSSVVDIGFLTLSESERSTLSKIQGSSVSRRRAFVDIPAQQNLYTDNLLVAESVIACSFYPKLLLRDGKGWRNVSNSSTIAIHPTSILRQAVVGSNHNPFQGAARYLSFYSITKSAGAKHPLAQYLHPVSPLPLLLLAGPDTNFHPLAKVVSIDGARLRFSLESEDWQIFVALKYFRARMEEIIRRRWRSPATMMVVVGGSEGARNLTADQNQLLSRWWALWQALIDATIQQR